MINKQYKEPLIRREALKEFIISVDGNYNKAESGLYDNFKPEFEELWKVVSDYKYKRDYEALDQQGLNDVTDLMLDSLALYRAYYPKEYNRMFWVIDAVLKEFKKDDSIISFENHSRNYSECIAHYNKAV
jgi:hypothetical protein